MSPPHLHNGPPQSRAGLDAAAGAVPVAPCAPAAGMIAGLSRNRWYVLAVLTVIFTFQTVDRNLVSVLAETIKHQFSLSDSQLGLLTGPVFAVSYVIAGIPIGLLVDRVNRVRLVALLLAVWSALTFFSGLARSFPLLVAARMGIAVGESGAAPTCMSLITDVFPRERRATALGWFFASGPIGLALGYVFGGLIAEHFGWRAAFFLAGGPGLLLSLLVVFTLREPPRGAQEAAGDVAQQRYSALAILREIWRRRALRHLLLAATVAVTAQAGISAFLAPYFIRIQHLPVAQVGAMVGLTLGLGGLIGMPLGGMLADRLERRAAAGGVCMAAIAMLLSAPAAAGGLMSGGIAGALAGIGAYAVLGSLYYGATFSAYLGNAPVAMRGAAGAFLIVVMNLVGYGLGPMLAGVFSDALHAAGVAGALRWSLVILASFYLLSSLFYLFAWRVLHRSTAAVS